MPVIPLDYEPKVSTESERANWWVIVLFMIAIFAALGVIAHALRNLGVL